MCESIVTTMACGHNIWHHVRRCAPSDWPSRCTKTVERRQAEDTCAECDPSIRRTILRASYEQRHGELMDLYRAAKGRGDEAEMKRLEGEIYDLVGETRQALFASSAGQVAARRRDARVDVDVWFSTRNVSVWDVALIIRD